MVRPRARPAREACPGRTPAADGQQTRATATAILHGIVRAMDPRSFTFVPSEGRADAVAPEKKRRPLRAPYR